MLCVALIVPASLDAQASTPAADPTTALPLELSRTIRFTTDEGTWMSIDVSPDGRSLVFDMIGDLYTLPISGGKATAITRGMGYDMQPRWSPDGRRIVFISDRDGDYGVWIANADGTTPRKVSKGEYHRFLSPFWQDQTHIIVGQNEAWPERSKGYELRIYDIETGEFEPIEGAPRGQDAKPIESASASLTTDGRFLYFSPWTAGLSASAWHLARLDRNTGEVLTLYSGVNKGHGGAMRPVVSSDGKVIVYASELDAQTGFRIRDTKTGDEAWLAYPVQPSQHLGPKYGLVPGYDFTPDRRALIAAWGGKIRRIDLATKGVSVIPFEAEVEQPIGPSTRFAARVDDRPTVRARLIQGTELSPDGKRAAFSALARIYVANLADGRTRRLTSSDEYEFQPDWSPDGRWITYVTWGMKGGMLMKARADGTGEPVWLAPAGPFYRDPVWSPDGDAVLALRTPKQDRQMMSGDWFPWYVPSDQQLIEVSALRGSDDPTVLADGADLWNPQLDAAGDRIFASAARNGGGDGEEPTNLVSLARDGSDRRIEMRIRSWAPSSASAYRGARIARSPDGAHLLATIEDIVYLINVGEVEPDSTGVKYLDMEKARSKLTKLDVSGADWVTWTDDGATLVWTRGATVLRQPLAATLRGAPSETHAQVETGRDSIVLTVEVPRSRPPGTVVLSGARIITMRGDEVLPAGDIMVTDNRIAAVGPHGQVTVPADAPVIDLTGKTIMPGLVDTHSHWNANLHDVLEIPAWPMVAALAYGVTSAFDPNPELPDMLVYQDLIDAGEFLGPRAFSTGPAIMMQRFVESRADADALMRRYRNNYGLDFVKAYVVGNRKQRQYVVQGARDVGIMPTAEGAFDFVMDMTHAIDGMAGHEHHIPIYPIFRDVIQLWVQSGISYSPTPTTASGVGLSEEYFVARADFHDNEKIARFWPHWRADRSRRARSTKFVQEYEFVPLTRNAVKILKAGGNVATGSHQANYGPGEHFQLWALVMAGASPLEAVRAGTINGARHIGYADDLGSIEAGKLADLIVLDRNPLENIENTLSIRYVMKNGELFDGATMNRIWPSTEQLTPMWFWEEDPVLSRTSDR